MAKKIKPVHPGEILHEEFMVPLRLSMNRMAMDLRFFRTLPRGTVLAFRYHFTSITL